MSMRRQLLATIFGFSALGFAILALIYWVVILQNSGMDRLLQVFLLAAIISFTAYLLITPESVGQAASRRSNKLTVNALVASAVALAIAFTVNVIVESIPAVRADWTAGKTFSLSDQTLSVLQDLDKHDTVVNAVAFYSNNSQSSVATTEQQIRDLLKEYSSRTSKLKYEIVDPYLSPARAVQYGVTQLGTVVFDNGKKREIAKSITEAEFTGALVRLNQTGAKTVVFLTGHGERNPNGFAQDGYSQVKDALDKDNYKTSTWNLTITPTITLSDATVLVIAQPVQPYTPNDVQAIQNYLNLGGHVLMLLDPEMTQDTLGRLSPVLQKYGVTAVRGGVVDLQKNYSQMGVGVLLLDTYPSGSEITRDLSSKSLQTLFPLSMGLKPPTSTGDLSVTSILQSSAGTVGDRPASWLETDLEAQTVAFDQSKDMQGPVTIGLTIGPKEETSSTPPTSTTTVKTRLVVFGDSDFASNAWVTQVAANQDLFANSVSWLAGANELVSIRAKDPEAPRRISLNTGQQSILFFSTVIGFPLLIILLGAFIWWRRR